MVKFEEMVNGGEDVKVKTSGGGVSKKGKKWRARLQHPKLKTEVHLGHYCTYEEAALAVKKKKAEFEEMSKEGCWDNFEETSGLKRRGVQISHPKLKSRVSFGSYSTPEETVVATDKRREEFQKMYGCKTGTRSTPECLDEQTSVLELPVGVSMTEAGRWVASIRDPASNFSCWSGTYDTAEVDITSFNGRKSKLAATTTRAEFEGSEVGAEANEQPVAPDSEKLISVADNLNSIPLSDKLNCVVVNVPDKFEEMVDVGEDIKVENCDWVSEVRKHVRGVSKNGKKWRARVQHPKLKIRVDLGSYNTPEEATLAVKKKEAEFEEMSKEGGWDDFEERKLPSNVRRSGLKRQGVQISHPKLESSVSLGSYSSPEEAAVADQIREEFWKMYGCRTGTRSTPECLDEQTSVLELPVRVSKTEAGRWVASIRDPASNFSCWSGTYDTAEGDITSFNRRKSELAATTTRAELEGSEVWSEANEEPVGPDAEMIISGSDNLNSIPISDKLNCAVVDVPDKSEEMVNVGEDVKVENCDGVSEVRKHIRGVSKNGKKWRARVQHPKLKIRAYLGSYSTHEEAALAVKKKEAEFEEMSKGGAWDDFDGSEANEEPVAPDSEMIISAADNLNSIPVSNKLNCMVVDAPDNLKYDVFPSSLVPVFEQENSNSSDVRDRSVILKEDQPKNGCTPVFDEAVSLGIISEYGLLLGKFSEVDEQMEFSLPDEEAQL